MNIRALLVGGLFLAACASQPADRSAPFAGPEASDPGVYLMVLGRVLDRPAFIEGYVAKLPPLYERFGGEYVVVSGQPATLEGAPDFESVVISHWPSEAAVRAFWTSPEYEALMRARTENGWGEFTVVIVPALPAAR